MEAAKRERNIVCFPDLEHYTLRLLTDEKDGDLVPSELARSLQKQYDVLIVDEYQDINGVQEAILCALSGESSGRPNLFMVGDVKQSIYRFRRAKPDIFIRKYLTFRDEAHRVIDLSRNFRSRRPVLDAVNGVFSCIMNPELGGIVYDERAALYPGAPYPERCPPSM